jgi:hypothetical protein
VRLRVLPADDGLETRVSKPESDYEGRPRTRAECLPGGEHYHRPCPFVGCRHNLFFDVDEATGEVLGGDPEADPWTADPDASCSLDVVEENPGGVPAEDAAGMMGMSAEQAEAIEVRALAQMQALGEMESLRQHSYEEEGATLLGSLSSNFQGGVERGLGDDEDDRSGRVLPDRFYFGRPPPARRGAARLFERHGGGAPVPDAEYARAFWKVYERSSRSRAEEREALADSRWHLLVDVLLAIADAQLMASPRKKFGRVRGPA